jgi:hypothetical protein
MDRMGFSFIIIIIIIIIISSSSSSSSSSNIINETAKLCQTGYGFDIRGSVPACMQNVRLLSNAFPPWNSHWN